MNPFTLGSLTVGATLLAIAFGLAIRYRREGGVEVYSGRWYRVVLLAGAGAGCVVGPLTSLFVTPLFS